MAASAAFRFCDSFMVSVVLVVSGMSPDVRQCRVWVCGCGPDEFLAAPDQKAVAAAGQGIFPPAKAEGAAGCVEIVNLSVPAGFAESLAVLAFKEGFHG
jgi:hypothetical protein